MTFILQISIFLFAEKFLQSLNVLSHQLPAVCRSSPQTHAQYFSPSLTWLTFKGSSACTSCSSPGSCSKIYTDCSEEEVAERKRLLTHNGKKNIPWSQDHLLPGRPVIDAHMALVRPVVWDPDLWQPVKYKHDTLSPQQPVHFFFFFLAVNKGLFPLQMLKQHAAT